MEDDEEDHCKIIFSGDWTKYTDQIRVPILWKKLYSNDDEIQRIIYYYIIIMM